jgi:uncharacterized membrane protein YqjE
MYPFWSNIYDEVKDRRYGALFFSTLLTLFVSLGIMALIGALTNGVGLVPALFLFAIPFAVAMVCAVSSCIRAWKYRDGSLNSSTLSRDELAKARSKLKKETKAAAFRTERRPARLVINRVPDTDLKY